MALSIDRQEAKRGVETFGDNRLHLASTSKTPLIKGI